MVEDSQQLGSHVLHSGYVQEGTIQVGHQANMKINQVCFLRINASFS